MFLKHKQHLVFSYCRFEKITTFNLNLSMFAAALLFPLSRGPFPSSLSKMANIVSTKESGPREVYQTLKLGSFCRNLSGI